MKKPIIRLDNGIDVIDTTGDVDAFEHGGGVIYTDPHDLRTYWTFWDQRELGQKKFDVFTSLVPEDVINFFKPEMEELSMVSGFKKIELVRLGKSRKISDRIDVLKAIKECFGSSSIDLKKFPEELSPFEMVERWGDVFGIEKDEFPISDYEDYMIRGRGNGTYESGRFDGLYLGRFADFKSAMSAVADDMSSEGSFDSILFYEHSFGELETVSWDPQKFIGKSIPIRGKLPEAPWRNLMKKYEKSFPFKNGNSPSLKSSRDVIKSRKRKMSKKLREDRIERARSFYSNKGKI